MFSHRGAGALCTSQTVQSLRVVVLVITFFICAPLMHLPRMITASKRRVWLALADSASDFPVKLLTALVSTLHLSRLSRNPQKRLFFLQSTLLRAAFPS